jgi:hypothetical protein
MKKLKNALYWTLTGLGVLALMLLASFGFAYLMCKVAGIV